MGNRANIKQLIYLKNGEAKSISTALRVQEVKKDDKRQRFSTDKTSLANTLWLGVDTKQCTGQWHHSLVKKTVTPLQCVWPAVILPSLIDTRPLVLPLCGCQSASSTRADLMKRSATTTISRTGRKVSRTRYWAGAIRNWTAKHREADKKGRQEQESRGPCYQFVIKIYLFLFSWKWNSVLVQPSESNYH